MGSFPMKLGCVESGTAGSGHEAPASALPSAFLTPPRRVSGRSLVKEGAVQWDRCRHAVLLCSGRQRAKASQ